MSLLSRPKKASLSEIQKMLESIIVDASLEYRTQLENEPKDIEIMAASELSFLLIHMLNEMVLSEVGSAIGNRIISKISARVSVNFAISLNTKNASKEEGRKLAEKIYCLSRVRENIYSRCNSFTGEGFPSAGTKIFAFSYFVHKVLNKIDRDDPLEILEGHAMIEGKDTDNFPDPGKILTDAIFIGTMLPTLKFNEYVDKLKELLADETQPKTEKDHDSTRKEKQHLTQTGSNTPALEGKGTEEFSEGQVVIISPSLRKGFAVAIVGVFSEDTVYTEHGSFSTTDVSSVAKCPKEWLDEFAQKELDLVNKEYKMDGSQPQIEQKNGKKGKFRKCFVREFKLLLLLLVAGGVLWFLAVSLELNIIKDQHPRRKYFSTDGDKEMALFLMPYLLMLTYRIARKSIQIVNSKA